MIRACLISWTSFQLPRWQTVLELRKKYVVDFRVVAPPLAKCPTVYDPSGYFSPSSVGLKQIPDFVTLINLKNKDNPSIGFNENALNSFLYNFDPDIIWIHGEPLDRVTLQVCRKYLFKKKPRLFQAAVENYQTLGQGSVMRRLYRWFLIQRINEFITASSSTSLSVKEDLHINFAKISVVYAPNCQPRVYSKETLSKQKFSIGFAGRLVAEKGIDILLHALAMLPDDIKLVTAGEGDKDIEVMLAENQRITHLGLLNNLDDFFSMIDVLIVPSRTTPRWKEQFGRVIAESFARAIPVIGSDSGSIPDVVGSAGMIYSEDSAEELAKRIEQFYSDSTLKNVLGEKALSRFHQHFSIEAHARVLASRFGLKTAIV